MRKSGTEVARARIPKLDPKKNETYNTFSQNQLHLNKPRNPQGLSEHLAIRLAGAPHICPAAVKKKGRGDNSGVFFICYKGN